MNISDIEVPGTIELYIWAIGFMVLAFIIAFAGGKFLLRRVSNRDNGDKAYKRATLIRFSAIMALAVVSLGGCAVAMTMGADHIKTADQNFARVLQDTYGATSSERYEVVQSSDNHEAWLTSGTKSTLVRFVFLDGKVTPYELLSTEFPHKTGS
jgi:heme/copper-type cytochrome/quinol oxidase subunit 1